jgi:glycine betaine/proline transport system permease protein
MSSFPDIFRFNLGQYVDQFVKWLMTDYGEVFDAIASGILSLLVSTEKILLWLPWWLVLLGILLLGWKAINIKAGIVFSISLFLVGTFGFWDLMMMTLAIVLASVIISLVIGIPLGVLTAYSDRFNAVMRPILDAMQTMPSFVYLIPALMLFGMGKVPAVFATIIYATPPVIRLTDLGIRKVPKEMVEASISFGSSNWQTLLKVQLPQALPTIMTGINQTTMMALSMVVVASMIGARGLGLEVLRAIQRIDIAKGFEAGISIVFLAIIIDRVSQGIAERFKYPE